MATRRNLFKVAVPLDLVDDFCRSVGITPMPCHHLRSTRANPLSPADLDDLAFSGILSSPAAMVFDDAPRGLRIGSGFHPSNAQHGGQRRHNSMWSAMDVDEGVFDSDDAAGDGLYGRHWDTCLRPADEARADAQHARPRTRLRLSKHSSGRRRAGRGPSFAAALNSAARIRI